MKHIPVPKCPDKLREWIELINSVPFGKENSLQSWSILIENAYFELTGEDVKKLQPPPPEDDYGEWQPPSDEQLPNFDKAFEKATESLKQETARFPKLYSYLFELKDRPEPENIYDEIHYEVKNIRYEKTAYQRYETFDQIRIEIKSIARSCMLYHKEGRFISNELTLQRLGFKRRDKGYRSDFIIENEEVNFESELTKAVRGIDPKRLRVCPICDEVFWAERIEAQTCPERRCKNNFHQRKRRIKEYEKKLDDEWGKLETERTKLEKLQNYKPPVPALIDAQTKTVDAQTAKFNKLSIKINKEKMKNVSI